MTEKKDKLKSDKLNEYQMQRFMKCEKLLFDTFTKLSEKISERAFKLEKMLFEMVDDCKLRREIDECEQKIDKHLQNIERAKEDKKGKGK